MQKKKGISLIVLVITIIVMIILAAAIVLSLNNAGIIGNANKAVEETDLANLKHMATLAWAEGYTSKLRTQEELEEYVCDYFEKNNIDTTGYKIIVTEKGTDVEKVKIITFYVGDYELQAEDGMTWFEWSKSKYNTIDLRCPTEESSITYGYDSTGFFSVEGYTQNGKFTSAAVLGKHQIIPVYYWVQKNDEL